MRYSVLFTFLMIASSSGEVRASSLGFVVDSDPVMPAKKAPPPPPIGMVNREGLRSDEKGFYYTHTETRSGTWDGFYYIGPLIPPRTPKKEVTN